MPDRAVYDSGSTTAKDIPWLKTSDINDQEVLSYIEKQTPDLVLLKGVSIINIHSGSLPDYRGVQCGTWPLVNNELDQIGITFHFVDEGLDTG